jgi:uncharacterized protein
MLEVLCLGRKSPPRRSPLQVPPDDAHRLAKFYQRVFGWHTPDGDTARPRLVDATAEGDNDVLFELRVDDVEETMARVWTHGGEVIDPPHLDAEGAQWLATFRDPAGNLIGLYQDESAA